MKNRLAPLQILFTTVILGCGGEGGPASSTAPDASLLAPAENSAARQTPGAVTHQQVTGHADIEFQFPDTTAVVDQYSFSAIRHQDGRFTGQFEFRAKYRGLRVRAHGDVLCFRIEGNRARLGGIITKTTFEDSPPPGLSGLPVGEELTWSVTDGRGNNDTASPLLGSNALAYCAGGISYPWEMPIRRGSIQIHP